MAYIFIKYLHICMTVHKLFHNICRCTMASWTTAHSIRLSQLLDDIVGTEEMVNIRRDYCRIFDSVFVSQDMYGNQMNFHTGSKAEGLDLPGSDTDVMLNMRNTHVFQTEQDALLAKHGYVFVMSTENVPKCFAV